MKPEIRRAIFWTHADCVFEGKVDAIPQGSEEGGVEGGAVGERGDREGDVR